MIVDQIIPRKYYTINELFEMVKIGENTIYRALYSGRLKGFKRGKGRGKWHITGKDFVEWFTDNTERFFLQ